MRALHHAVAATIVLTGSLFTPSGSNAQTQASATAASRTETGEINGASYRIDIPAGWNKGHVMYAHGYTVVRGKHTGALPGTILHSGRDTETVDVPATRRS